MSVGWRVGVVRWDERVEYVKENMVRCCHNGLHKCTSTALIGLIAFVHIKLLSAIPVTRVSTALLFFVKATNITHNVVEGLIHIDTLLCWCLNKHTSKRFSEISALYKECLGINNTSFSIILRKKNSALYHGSRLGDHAPNHTCLLSEPWERNPGLSHDEFGGKMYGSRQSSYVTL